MKVEIKLTGDGSHTLYVPGLNEHYHSVHGAVAESEHVFINAGLKAVESKQINILEVGMGTGLNLLLTFLHAHQHAVSINYLAYEPFPLAREIWEKLNYCSLPGFEGLAELFSMIHGSEFNMQIEPGEHFVFKKMKEKIEDANIPDSTFHLVYFDAFAPGVQPEMWDQSIFRKLFKACHNDGILVTYSAKGEVRRNLIDVGFVVEKLRATRQAGYASCNQGCRGKVTVPECDYFTKKPLKLSTGDSFTVTVSTFAQGGPLWHQSTKRFRFSSSPSASM